MAELLDVGDGLTIDRDLALVPVRHQLVALKLVLGVPSLNTEALRDLAIAKVAHLLGGDDWLEVANDLVAEALREEASDG